MAARADGLKLTVAAGLALGSLLFVVLPVMYLFAEQNDEIDQSKHLLAICEAEKASRPQLEAQLAALRQREETAAGLVAGGSAALSAANIQSAMKSLVEAHGGKVRSVQNLPSTPSQGFEKIAVQYDLSIPVGGLKGLVYSIETHVPYLFLADVDIRTPEGWQNEGPLNAPPDLQIRWTVEGYREAGR